MSIITVAVLLVVGGACIAGIFIGPTKSQFSAYCDRVAEITGRIKERQSIWNADDADHNAFEREQRLKLMRGEYTEWEDPALVAQGRELARKFRLLRWVFVGGSLAFVAIACLQAWVL